jgi:thiol-disulfide isomerase/thioredoxin/YHS domain-containing protein
MPAIRGSILSFALVALLVSNASSQTAPIRWETNLDQAIKTAAASNRLVLVHFWAPWCRPCQKLESTVFKQPNFSTQIEAKYVPVKLDLDQNHALAQKYGVTAIPTDVILTPQGQIVYKTPSPQSADVYLSTMQQVAAKHGGAALVANKPASAVPNVTPPAPQQPIQQQPAPLQPQQQLPPAAGPTSSAPMQQPATPPTGTKMAAVDPNASGDSRYDYYYSRGGNSSAPNTAPATPMTPPVSEPPQVASQPATPAPVDQRYAAQQPITPSAPPGIALPGVFDASGPMGTAQSQPALRYAEQPAPTQQAMNPPAAQPTQTARGPITQAQLPAGSPPLALEGFCPVTLTERRQWTVGDLRFGAVHRGRTYLFQTQADQQRFLANPDRFSPVMAGNDPVLALNANQSVAGRREHGVFYNDRVFLFSTEDTLNEFAKNPTRYSAEITSAMKQ